MPESARDALSDLFDNFLKEDWIELWQVLKLDNSLRKALELMSGNAILWWRLIRLKHFDSFSNEQDLLS